MNWIHADATTFSVVAGMNSCLVSSSRLTVRGLGSMKSASDSDPAASSGTLRPKRVRAAPMTGPDRSLYDPSTVRAVRYDASYGIGCRGGLLVARLVS